MIARSDSWKHEPLADARAIPFVANFTETEFDRIRHGLVPEAMEDKWFIYFDEPSLFLHRSWTGQGIYRVDFEDTVVTNAVCEKDMVSLSGPAYHAALLNFLISNLLLGKAIPFPMPDDMKEVVPGVLQHSVSGTGYSEVPVKTRRSWWRFWR